MQKVIDTSTDLPKTQKTNKNHPKTTTDIYCAKHVPKAIHSELYTKYKLHIYIFRHARRCKQEGGAFGKRDAYQR